jgi:rod shape-determining protein MreD
VVPLTDPIAASLPAVLVACVALREGVGTGMSFGFVLGLVTDLGSRHPAGVLALTWLGLGLVAGRLASRRSVRADAVTAGVLCALAAAVASVLLAVVHADGASLGDGMSNAIPASLVDALLALAVGPVVRALLGTHAMRSPVAISREVVLGAGHD